MIGDLIDLVHQNLTEGVSVHLERARYLNEYRAPPIPKKMNLDSQLGVCFRACLGHFHDLLGLRRHKDKFHIVFESGHPNVWDCGRIFSDLQKRWERVGINTLATFAVKDKKNCMPLMAADMLAAAHSMRRASVAGGEIAGDAYVLEERRKRQANLAFLELTPDSLGELKRGFDALRQHEIDEWRAKRAALIARWESSLHEGLA